MKKQALVTVSMAALLLSAVSPFGIAQAQTNMLATANKAQAITFDQLVKEIDIHVHQIHTHIEGEAGHPDPKGKNKG